MFETATWRTHNKNHWAVVENIYRSSGCKLPVPDGFLDLEEEDRFAASLVHNAGAFLLPLLVAFATSHGENSSSRRNTKAWKQITPDTGTAASIYLTLAISVLLRPEFAPYGEIAPVIAQEPVEVAEVLVKQTFGFPEEQWNRIEGIREEATEELESDMVREAIERGGSAGARTVDIMRMKFTWDALELAGLDPRSMPNLSHVANAPMDVWGEIEGLDWYTVHAISARITWRHGEEAFLERAFAPWEAVGRCPAR